MCFRPADVSAGPKECPACGKVIPVIAGMPFPETCPGCGADVSSSTLQRLPLPQARLPPPRRRERPARPKPLRSPLRPKRRERPQN